VRGLTAAAVLAAALVIMLVAAAGAFAATATSGAVLTLRTDGDHDALWLVTPAGDATAAGVLPGIAETVAVAPDGSSVAYLPNQSKPAVWIGHGPYGPKTISLKGRGISGVGGLTWISEDKLLISATSGGKYYDLYTAKLFTVDVKSGVLASFRKLQGCEPSCDPSTGKVVYVKFKKLSGGNAKNDHTPEYEESMMLTAVNGTGAGTELDSVQYWLYYEQQQYTDPQLAPGAQWIIAGSHGSDPETTYTIYDGVGYASPWLTLFSPSPQAAAWTADGRRVAFTGIPMIPGDVFDDGCVYVMNVLSGTLERTPKDLFTGVAKGWLDGVDWTDDGSLVVDGLDSDTLGQSGQVFLVGPGLDTVKALGEGHLSVWVH
jgi:hypothetical protein